MGLRQIGKTAPERPPSDFPFESLLDANAVYVVVQADLLIFRKNPAQVRDPYSVENERPARPEQRRFPG
jgi:hypothetical protein